MKTTDKKTPPKKAAPKKVAGKFNILEDGPSMTASIRETLARSEADVMMAGDPNKKKLVLPVPAFNLCAALKARGLVSGTVLDVIGADGLGKSSLGWTLMGWGMAANGPAMYAEVEGKPLDRRRAEACLHPDKRIASIFYDSVYKVPVREMREAANTIERWLITIRGPASRYPQSATAVIVLDTLSKLMSPNEAEGFAVYDSKKDEAKKKEKAKLETFKAQKKGQEAPEAKVEQDTSKELGSGSNLQHSKLSHEWARRIAYFLGKYNAILVLLRHQNDKIDMGGGGGMVLSAEQKDAFNRTTNCGRAWHQSAAYQLILSNMGFVKGSIGGIPQNVGLNVKVRISKNGWGPSGTECFYRVNLQPRYETETRYESALSFDPGIPDYVAAHKLMKTRLKNVSTVITSDFNEAGRAEEVDLYRFGEMFYQHGWHEKLGRQQSFAHFDDNTQMHSLIATHVPELIEPDANAVDNEAPPVSAEAQLIGGSDGEGEATAEDK